jgi:hypothetical protein
MLGYGYLKLCCFPDAAHALAQPAGQPACALGRANGEPACALVPLWQGRLPPHRYAAPPSSNVPNRIGHTLHSGTPHTVPPRRRREDHASLVSPLLPRVRPPSLPSRPSRDDRHFRCLPAAAAISSHRRHALISTSPLIVDFGGRRSLGARAARDTTAAAAVDAHASEVQLEADDVLPPLAATLPRSTAGLVQL